MCCPRGAARPAVCGVGVVWSRVAAAVVFTRARGSAGGVRALRATALAGRPCRGWHAEATRGAARAAGNASGRRCGFNDDEAGCGARRGTG